MSHTHKGLNWREEEMNKYVLIVVCIISFVILISCSPDSKEVDVPTGTYELVTEGLFTSIKPNIHITDGSMIFTYDVLSSYLPIGSYVVDGNKLTMTTYDKEYVYSFRIEEESLFFIMNESSAIELIDNSFGMFLKDNAEFRLSGD